MSRSIIFEPNEYYHLYNRGTEKRNIFSNKKDYERFSALLYLCNNNVSVHISNNKGLTLVELLSIERNKPLVKIGVYCLMPNHFHLLVEENITGGISRFMQKLLTGYTMYFNTKYERSGTLFQGTFKARHVRDERYLFHLISYIHLNPVKFIDPYWKENGIANRKIAEEYLNHYLYSSFLDYLGHERIEGNILSRDVLSSYFDSPIDFKRSVEEWFDYNPD